MQITSPSTISTGTGRKSFLRLSFLGLLMLILAACTTMNTGEVNGVTLSPADREAAVGESVTLTATVDATGELNKGVDWEISPTSGATFEPSGNTAEFTGTAPGEYTITATSLADDSKSASTTITVVEGDAEGAVLSVEITGAPSAAVTGEEVAFSATVSVEGSASEDVTWSVEPAEGATIDAGGTFVATTAGTYTVTATSVADTSKSDSAEIEVTAFRRTGEVVVAINAGHSTIDGEYLSDSEKVLFEANQYVESPGIANARTPDPNEPIEGTEDDQLYRSEIYGEDFTYEIPVGQPGDYRVTLYFAEIYLEDGHAEEDRRIFDVTIFEPGDVEPEAFLLNYDVTVAAGGVMTAVTEEWTGSIEGTEIHINFLSTAESGEPAKISAIKVERLDPLD